MAKSQGYDGITFLSLYEDGITPPEFCDYEIECPPSARTDPIPPETLTYEDHPAPVSVTQTHLTDEHQALLCQDRPATCIRGLFPSWDNLQAYPNVDHLKVYAHSNSFMFYLTLVMQLLKIKQEKGEYLVLNALNDWDNQCVLEPTIETGYSYLEAYKLATHTDVNKVDETLLSQLITFIEN